MPTPPLLSQLLTEQEAAHYLNVSRSFLAQGRMKGGDNYPPFIRLGRAIRYSLAALDAWLEGKTFTNTLYPKPNGDNK
jgi:hypothetical protein